MKLFELIKKNLLLFILIVVALLSLTGVLVYKLWFKSAVKALVQEPISEALDLPEDLESRYPGWNYYYETVYEEPVCGDQDELLILLAGIDYRSSDYLYGLADVIRLIHVDFTVPSVNVVALPRALLVEVPEGRIDVDDPILLNQAYFFGTSGMGKYVGSGLGAGSLAEVIQYNFNLKADQYLVIDFNGFKKVIDALGGIEVDLPMAIDAGSAGYFPEGKQVLNGEQALRLARTRKNYSDNVRISNQSLIIQGILDRLQSPDILLKLPELIEELQETVLTDASPAQIKDALCLVEKLDQSDISFFQPAEDVISTGWAFVPSMDKEMNIYNWGEDFLSWLYAALYFKQ